MMKLSVNLSFYWYLDAGVCVLEKGVEVVQLFWASFVV